MTFGTVLRNLLKKHKISQRKLAKWSNLNYVTICRFIADTQTPEQASVEAIAYAHSFTDEEVIALFRAARQVPSRLIEMFADDEEFARLCWERSCQRIKACGTMRTPRLYA